MPHIMWWLIGIALLVALYGLLFALLATAKREDRQQRHYLHRISPWEDVTITRDGSQ